MTVADGHDFGTAQQAYVLSVSEVNVAPQITSTPDTSIAVDVTYTYQVRAFDPDGDPLSYGLEIAPGGMTVDPNSGLLEWLPHETGTSRVRMWVSDRGRGSRTSFAEEQLVIETIAINTGVLSDIVGSSDRQLHAGFGGEVAR